MEKITITTNDSVDLSGLFWNKDAFSTVLLMHMMPSKKEAWVPLADKLADLGFNVLAFDFRGHGESGGGDYKTYTSEQHREYYLDMKAAIRYLEDTFSHTEIYLGGASIGANLVIKYMSEHRDFSNGFALSPGLDYYGVRAIDDIKNLNEDQRILLVGANDDMRSSGSDCGAMVEMLYEAGEGIKEKIVYETGGHGTDLLDSHPELEEKLIKFISE
jgi:pimeloyl-ACP methyl ester carboxylesterase